MVWFGMLQMYEKYRKKTGFLHLAFKPGYPANENFREKMRKYSTPLSRISTPDRIYIQKKQQASEILSPPPYF